MKLVALTYENITAAVEHVNDLQLAYAVICVGGSRDAVVVTLRVSEQVAKTLVALPLCANAACTLAPGTNAMTPTTPAEARKHADAYEEIVCLKSTLTGTLIRNLADQLEATQAARQPMTEAEGWSAWLAIRDSLRPECVKSFEAGITAAEEFHHIKGE